MLSFLFWNINSRPLQSLVADLVETHEIDVLILAECNIPAGVMLETLNRSESLFDLPFSQCEAISIYTRFPRQFLTPCFESRRTTIRRLSLPQRPEVLLAAVHLPSKLRWSADSQALECPALANTIREEELKVGHDRTILVGDLNMNPFEHGVVGAAGLNAAMTRRVADRESRTVQGRPYPYFYNPMWGFFGDRFSDSAGTYFYDRAEHVNYCWNVFDQVLVRPALATHLPPDQPRVLTSIGNTSLVTADGQPDKKAASDHLPLLFKIDI